MTSAKQLFNSEQKKMKKSKSMPDIYVTTSLDGIRFERENPESFFKCGEI